MPNNDNPTNDAYDFVFGKDAEAEAQAIIDANKEEYDYGTREIVEADGVEDK